MSLGALIHPRAGLVLDERHLGRDAILQHAKASSPLSGVVETPAGDPLTALSTLDAAWRGGALPMPCRGLGQPRSLPYASIEGALLLRTSGSTGEPRLATFSVEALSWSVAAIGQSLGLEPGDRIGLVAPVDHGFGLIGVLLAGLAAGAQVVVAGGAFAEERASRVARGRCTVVAAVPSVLDGLVQALPAEARGRVRQLGSAGGPLSPAVVDRLRTACPKAVLLNQYGCTEAGPRLTICRSDAPVFDRGSVGQPLPGVQIEIDQGEIVFSSPGQMMGYLGQPDATAQAACRLSTGADGWRTGDLGRVEGGALYVEGRRDDRVKIRGEWVDLGAISASVTALGATQAFATTVSGGAAEPRVVVLYVRDEPLRALDVLPHLPPGIVPRLRRVDALPALPSGKLDRVAAHALAEIT